MKQKKKPFVEEFVDQTFLGNQLTLDRRRYVRCRFVEIDFVYSGGPWHVEDCRFEGTCRVHWRGPARWTRNLEKHMETLGFEEEKVEQRRRKK